MSAADKAGRQAATFPVWVGSLDERVTEKQLQKRFSKFGSISNIKIQRDAATGRSKGFGWVNFHEREAAEQSAAKMAGASLCGSPIKTRGPRELEKKGLFSPPRTDFRPLTDCTFFIQGKLCKKGTSVEPNTHSLSLSLSHSHSLSLSHTHTHTNTPLLSLSLSQIV